MLFHLSYEQVVRINEILISRYGGLDPHVLNPGSLHHILDATIHTVFGVDRYPTVEEKAVAIASAIVQKHVFSDGNKRTGAVVLVTLLELNSASLTASNDAERLYVRVTVSAAEAPTPGIFAIFFVRLSEPGPIAGDNGLEIHPDLETCPRSHYAVSVMSDGSIGEVWEYNGSYFWPILSEISPLDAQGASLLGVDPIGYNGLQHGYFEVSLALEMMSISAGVGLVVSAWVHDDAVSFGDEWIESDLAAIYDAGPFGNDNNGDGIPDSVDEVVSGVVACTTDAECSFISICGGGSCIAGSAECADTSDCRSGQWCNTGTGRCAWGVEACSTVIDCPGSSACGVDGFCASSCSDDSECGMGVCISDGCMASSYSSPPECMSAMDCGAFAKVEGLPLTGECTAGLCEMMSCGAEGTCDGIDEVCYAGVCVYQWHCLTDDDCEDWQSCNVRNECQLGSFTVCYSDADCPEGDPCFQNTCNWKPVAPPGGGDPSGTCGCRVPGANGGDPTTAGICLLFLLTGYAWRKMIRGQDRSKC